MNKPLKLKKQKWRILLILNEINNSENESFSEIEQNSNGLENFGVEEESPDLFSSNQESFESEELSSKESSEDQSEDDDLEIPAFLRRQKN